MDSYNDESDQENQDSNSSCNVPSASSTENIENKAICNLLTDTDIYVGLSEPAAHGSRNIKRLLKDFQLYRESPLKIVAEDFKQQHTSSHLLIMMLMFLNFGL